MKLHLKTILLPLLVLSVFFAFSGCEPADVRDESALGVLGTIHGTLVDHTGEPIADASVEYYAVNAEEAQELPEAEASSARGFVYSLTTDAHGFFSIDNLNPGHYYISFIKEGYFSQRTSAYILTIDEIEKQSGLDFQDTDSNTTIYLKDGKETDVSLVDGYYVFSQSVDNVMMYGKVAGLTGLVERQITSGSYVPAEGITVIVTPTSINGGIKQFPAVTDADGVFIIADGMPVTSAVVSMTAKYYVDEDLYYDTQTLESSIMLSSAETAVPVLDKVRIAPADVRPLILAGSAGTDLAPMAVDGTITLTFSVAVESLNAAVGLVAYDVAFDETMKIATLTPADENLAYGLDGSTDSAFLSLSGETADGEAISDASIEVFTPDAMQLLSTNIYNAGGLFAPTTERIYDDPAKVTDFPVTGGTITFTFDQELDNTAGSYRAEVYRKGVTIETRTATDASTVDISDDQVISNTATVSGNTLSIAIPDGELEAKPTQTYYVAFEVASTRADDTFGTAIGAPVVQTASGITEPPFYYDYTAGTSVLPTTPPVAAAETAVLYNADTLDEYVVFETTGIRLVSTNAYDADGSQEVLYDSAGALIANPAGGVVPGTPGPTDPPNAPTDSAIGVDDNIVLTFSKNISTHIPYDNIENVALYTAANVPVNADVSVASNVLTINPTTSLDANTQYYIQFSVSASAVDESGDQVIYFVTENAIELDDVASNVREVTVAANGTETAQGASSFTAADPLELVFTKTVVDSFTDLTDFELRLTNASGAIVPTTPAISTDLYTVTLTPASDLIFGQTYYVAWNAFHSANDSVSGNTTFTVEQNMQLTETNFGAVTYATEVLQDITAATAGAGTFLIGDTIDLTFDKAVDNTTTSADDFSLYWITGTTPDTSYEYLDLEITVSGNTVSVTPGSVATPVDLLYDTVYYLDFTAYAEATDSFTDGATVLSFRTEPDTSVAGPEQVLGFAIDTANGTDDVTGTVGSPIVDYNATSIGVTWTRSTERSNDLRYYFYADTAAGIIPLLVTDTDATPDGNLDVNYTFDTADTTYAERANDTLTFTIDLSESIDNVLYDTFGSGTLQDTLGIFSYSNEITLYMTASDTAGNGESVVSTNLITLSDNTPPTIGFTGALPVAGATSTITVTQSEDFPYDPDPATYVSLTGAANPDLSIVANSGVWTGNNSFTIDVALAGGGTQVGTSGIQIAGEDTSGNSVTTANTLVY